MKPSWFRRGAAVAGVVMALVAMPSAPVQASLGPTGSKDPSEQNPTDATDAYQVMKAQLGATGMKNNEDLNSFKSWLLTLPGLYAQGFYESAVNINSRTMTLLWHGASPLMAQAVIEGAKRGLTIRIKPVDYTRDSVLKSMTMLTDPRNADRFGGLRVSSVAGPTLTNDSLTVRLAAGTTAPATATAKTAVATVASADVTPAPQSSIDANRSSLAATVKDMTGMNATFEPAVSQVPYATTRSTDSSPYNGGGLIRGDGVYACTSGFGIVMNGATWTTTARHCSFNTNTAWDSSSHSYGTWVAADDNTGMRILSGEGYYWMFSGAYNSTARKTVSGLADVSLNSQVCVSGGNSGVHCNLVVEEMLETFYDGVGNFMTIRARAQSGIALAAGDSGSPVFIPQSDGKHVQAVGMAQGGGASVGSCSSVRLATTTCSVTVNFTSERVFLDDMGATLYTGP